MVIKMSTELETRVAEARCPCGGMSSPSQIAKVHLDGSIEWCSGLRWPTLSRVCPGGSHEHFGVMGDYSHYHTQCRLLSRSEEQRERWGADYLAKCAGGCHGSGHIPDVTLEKVFPFIEGIWRDGGGWAVCIAGHIHYIEDWTGEHPLEATCAALLASVGGQ